MKFSWNALFTWDWKTLEDVTRSEDGGGGVCHKPVQYNPEKSNLYFTINQLFKHQVQTHIINSIQYLALMAYSMAYPKVRIYSLWHY